MNSSLAKYFALVMELPGLMLFLAYAFQRLDQSQHIFGGYGALVGLVSALALWIFHVFWFIKNSDSE
jgi:hypothetical protein